MPSLALSPSAADCLTCSFVDAHGHLRSRSVGSAVLATTLPVSPLPARLTSDWQNEISRELGLSPGDVEPLPMARARARWPDYRHCVHAVDTWSASLGMGSLLADCDVALMACRGARYHHDGVQYGAMAFCNLFVGDDKFQDLHFPATGQRIPIVPGTAVVFDTGQPHAVIGRDVSGFDEADFAGPDDYQVFLSWELPIEDPAVSRALQIDFDVDPAAAQRSDGGQLWLNHEPAVVCTSSGKWMRRSG